MKNQHVRGDQSLEGFLVSVGFWWLTWRRDRYSVYEGVAEGILQIEKKNDNKPNVSLVKEQKAQRTMSILDRSSN